MEHHCSRWYVFDKVRSARAYTSAGLLSLIVELFRVETFPCTHDDLGRPISNDPDRFPYGNATCGLVCNQDQGPFSPIRGGSADNIYLVPAPTRLSPHAGILVAAACCVPGILLAAALGFTLFKNSWATRWGKSALNMRASVAFCEPGDPVTTLTDLRSQLGRSAKLGIIRITAKAEDSNDAASSENDDRPKHVEDAADTSSRTSAAASTTVDLLHSLHAESVLTKYEFEIGRSRVQLLEINLEVPAKDNAEEVLTKLYADMFTLEREDVQVIFVDARTHDAATEEAITQLRNDDAIRKGIAPERRQGEIAKSLGKPLQIILFGGAVLAILIAGERNLFSSQVRYQTEPMANVGMFTSEKYDNPLLNNPLGQWAPVAGTAFAVVGSVWVLLADAVQNERRLQRFPEPERLDWTSLVLRKIVRALITLSDNLRPARRHFDDSGFTKSTTRYPVTPGQQYRDPDLHRTISNYVGSHRGSEESVHSARSGRPSSTMSPAERMRSNTGSREGAIRRRETLELPEQPSPVHRPQRRSTQNSLPPSPLERSRTLHESSHPNAPDITVSENDIT